MPYYSTVLSAKTVQILNREGKTALLECRVCLQPLKAGEEVVWQAHPTHKRNRIHLSCAKEKNYSFERLSEHMEVMQ